MASELEKERRLARERILSLLYEIEMKGQTAAEIFSELPVEPEKFVTETVIGVGAKAAELDELVDRYAIDWKTDRMASIDRNVLRLGAWELQYRPDLPIAVVISEAVELAKVFSTDESGKFVNGILSAIATDLPLRQIQAEDSNQTHS